MGESREIIFNCGHLARFTPRSDSAFVETDRQVIIERPCANCKGKNKVAVKAGRIARWLERRQVRKEKIAAYLASRPKIKAAEPVKLNRKQRRMAKING